MHVIKIDLAIDASRAYCLILKDAEYLPGLSVCQEWSSADCVVIDPDCGCSPQLHVCSKQQHHQTQFFLHPDWLHE